MATLTGTLTSRATVPGIGHVLAGIARALLFLLSVLVIVVLVLPVVLSPLVTSIPLALVLVLLLANIAVVVISLRTWHGWRAFAAIAGGALGVTALAVVLSQTLAATPPIVDANRKPLANSIATMEKVTLGGSEQWITIRGKNVNNPVLLYLGIGGPGAGGFPATAMNLAPLEDHFVVVNWDQPGTGKSYSAVPIPTLTVERMVSDAHELTEILRARFHQDKIYVMGLSWGTILGTKLVKQYPELFRAYVGTGQMVNTFENDRAGYELAIKIAGDKGDTGTVNALVRNGPPPYFGDGMAVKYMLYNDVLFAYMGSPSLEMVLVIAPQFAREYGWVDKVNFGRGLVESYSVLYPQLRDLDFTVEAGKVDVPMYFLVGREDINALASLVERYYNALQAPQKELIWLDSGHGATSEEILDGMVNHVLPQTGGGR